MAGLLYCQHSVQKGRNSLLFQIRPSIISLTSRYLLTTVSQLLHIQEITISLTMVDAAALYDFVIVGGSTSGLTVAARPSEDPRAQVLVLETGDNYLKDPRVAIPALCIQAPSTELD